MSQRAYGITQRNRERGRIVECSRNIRLFDPRTKRIIEYSRNVTIIPLLKNMLKDPDRHQIPIRVFQVGLSRTVLLTNSAYILGIEAEQEAVTRHIQLHLIDNGGFKLQERPRKFDQVHDDVFAVVEFDPEHFSAFIRKSASPWKRVPRVRQPQPAS